MPFKLDFSEGRLTRNSFSELYVHDFNQEGNVVSWSDPSQIQDELPMIQYIGIIDGNTMKGRVYISPGYGWHADKPEEYGTWKIYTVKE